MLIRFSATVLLIASAASAQMLARPYVIYESPSAQRVLEVPQQGSIVQLTRRAFPDKPHQLWDEVPVSGQPGVFRLVSRRTALQMAGRHGSSWLWHERGRNTALQMWRRETDTTFAGYRLKNIGTGKYLEVNVPLGYVRLAWRRHHPCQMWTRIERTAWPSYVIENRKSRYVMDVPNSTMSVSPIQQYLPHTFNEPNNDLTTNWNPAQHFQLRHVGNGEFVIISRATGLVLDVPGFSTAENLRIQQYPINFGTNQRWKLDYAGSGYWHLRSVATGKLLAIEHGSTATHAKLVQRTPNPFDPYTFQWRFVRRR